MRHCKWLRWPFAVLLAVVWIGILLCGTVLLLWQPALQKAQKKRLDNPYINRDYVGWTEVRLFEAHGFKLPGEWRVEMQDDSTYVISHADEVVAYAGKLGGGASYADTSDFCAAVVESEAIASYEDAVRGEHFGNGCRAYRIAATDRQNHSEQYYYLDADLTAGRCGMIFLDAAMDQKELLDYVIAIAWSYTGPS